MTRVLPPRAPLETERLRLREWVLDDIPLLQAALNENVGHLDPWVPWARPEGALPDQAAGLIDRWRREAARNETLNYAIFDTDTTLIGGIGVYDRIGPGAIEIGYWIRRPFTGAGFATEATWGLVDHVRRHVRSCQLEMHVHPRNSGSRRIPEKLGFTKDVRRSKSDLEIYILPFTE